MLVSLAIYRVMLVVTAIALAACLGLVLIDRLRAAAPVLVAPARLSRPMFVRRVAPVLGLIAAIAACWHLCARATDVVVIRDGGAATRSVYLGAPDHYDGLPRRDERDAGIPRDPTWILNESDRTVLIVTLVYDHRERTAIAPGELAVVPAVEYLGPDDALPTTCPTSTVGPEVRDTCSWVTW